MSTALLLFLLSLLTIESAKINVITTDGKYQYSCGQMSVISNQTIIQSAYHIANWTFVLDDGIYKVLCMEMGMVLGVSEVRVWGWDVEKEVVLEVTMREFTLMSVSLVDVDGVDVYGFVEVIAVNGHVEVEPFVYVFDGLRSLYLIETIGDEMYVVRYPGGSDSVVTTGSDDRIVRRYVTDVIGVYDFEKIFTDCSPSLHLENNSSVITYQTRADFLTDNYNELLFTGILWLDKEFQTETTIGNENDFITIQNNQSYLPKSNILYEIPASWFNNFQIDLRYTSIRSVYSVFNQNCLHHPRILIQGKRNNLTRKIFIYSSDHTPLYADLSIRYKHNNTWNDLSDDIDIHMRDISILKTYDSLEFTVSKHGVLLIQLELSDFGENITIFAPPMKELLVTVEGMDVSYSSINLYDSSRVLISIHYSDFLNENTITSFTRILYLYPTNGDEYYYISATGSDLFQVNTTIDSLTLYSRSALGISIPLRFRSAASNQDIEVDNLGYVIDNEDIRIDYLVQFHYNQILKEIVNPDLLLAVLSLPLIDNSMISCGQYQTLNTVTLLKFDNWTELGPILSLDQVPESENGKKIVDITYDQISGGTSLLLDITDPLLNQLFNEKSIISFRISGKNQCYLDGISGSVKYCHDIDYLCSPSLLLSVGILQSPLHPAEHHGIRKLEPIIIGLSIVGAIVFSLCIILLIKYRDHKKPIDDRIINDSTFVDSYI